MDDRLHDVLTEINGKLSSLEKDVAVLLASAADRHTRAEELEKRVRQLEQSRAMVWGFAAALGAVGGYVAQLLAR